MVPGDAKNEVRLFGGSGGSPWFTPGIASEIVHPICIYIYAYIYI